MYKIYLEICQLKYFEKHFTFVKVKTLKGDATLWHHSLRSSAALL